MNSSANINLTVLISLFYFLIIQNVEAQNYWTQKANFGGGAREQAVGFSINGKGYIGCGIATYQVSDLWEYDPTFDSWAQMANYPDSGYSIKPVAFVIGAKAYVGTGIDSDYTYSTTFYEYDPSSNNWTQKTNFIGTGRAAATGFSIGNKGYLGTGLEGGLKDDFWEYDPSSNNWTQKANFGGTARSLAVGFSINGKGYLGTGFDVNYNTKTLSS